MSEKRFTMSEDNFIEDNSKIISVMSREEILFELNHLNNENEELKSIIKAVYELLTIEVDVFTDKATEHDTIAYRELNQLDNKDAYYMATGIKQAIKMLKGDVE